ncbi:autism susceptibility gene 2-like protein [Labeo rohita]|uniref:Autism susceptibility gene 2-like protein n=1 Tax=Labeo rohita TaxID=84645 RepID=A0A498LF72_LABRO|nr:autism susceptibility gene 2-like protein [Labeo rohita]
MELQVVQKDMTLKPHERRQNQAGPLRKKKPGRVPNGLSLDLHKDRLNHNNHQHHHSDQENNPRLAHTHSKKKKYLQKKPRPLLKRTASNNGANVMVMLLPVSPQRFLFL